MTVLAHPVTILAACALTLAGALLLFFTLQREMARVRASAAEQQRQWAEERSQLRRALEALTQEIEEGRKMARDAPPMMRESMNLSKRSQALRLHRMGESPERIAASLGMSRMEVDLLLKVHQTVLESVQRNGAAAGG
ncbi:MAG: hypothetical protein WHT08_03615 [Bryobacteraceae bacterium]